MSDKSSDLSRYFDELKTFIRTEIAAQVKTAVSEALAEFSVKTEPKRSVPPKELTPTQAGVFSAIDKITGSGAKARQQAQRELRKLESDRVTKALTNSLKEVLKDRGWGLSCPNPDCHRAPSAPCWQGKSTCAAGGFLIHQHRDSFGGFVRHSARTKLGKLTIVERVDGRLAVDI